MKKICFFLLLTSMASYLFSQNKGKYDKNWLLGSDDFFPNEKLGGYFLRLDNNVVSGNIFKIPFSMGVTNTSISDKEGNLLFYTNGCSVAGKDHKILQNGKNLNPGPVSKLYCENGYITGQGAFFLPDLAKDSIYHLFHTGLDFGTVLPTLTTTLYQTSINAKLNQGLGTVIEKNKILLKDAFADEQLSVVKHGNGRDWWIVNPGFLDNRLIKFLYTPQGIKGPFIQKYGVIQKDTAAGQATFSPDGTKYARPNISKTISLMRFDRCTGMFYNEINLPFPNYAVGVSFSPNSRFLYLMTYLYVYQYDTEAADIAASQVVLFKNDGKEQPFTCPTYASQLAPDGKIYISCPGSDTLIHRIEYPDLAGKACSLKLGAIKLPVYNQGSMPYFPNYNLGQLAGSLCDTLKVSNDELYTQIIHKVYPNPTEGVFSIEISSNNSDNLHLVLFDAFGKKIYQQELKNNENKYFIDLHSFQNGIYFYKIVKNDNTIIANGKVIKVE